MKTIQEELDQAKADLATAQTKVTAAETAAATAKAEATKAQQEAATAKGEITAKDAKISELEKKTTEQATEITNLKKQVSDKETEVEKRANIKARETLAKNGHQPANEEQPAAGNDAKNGSLSEQLNALRDNPRAYTEFYRANKEGLLKEARGGK